MEPIDIGTSESESNEWDLELYKAINASQLEDSAASSSNTRVRLLPSHVAYGSSSLSSNTDTLIDCKPRIDLPTKTIDLTIEERAFYLKIESESRSRFKAYDASGTVELNSENIRSMLLRLRQACQHPLLVKGFGSESNDDADDERCLAFQNDYISSKIRASLEMIRSEGPIKVIIFSQWARMLNLVEMSLNQLCIKYRRLRASMSLVSRDTTIKEFNSDPQVVIMLMLSQARNVDLRMVAASHVIILDVLWDPAAEDEAVDQAHRIGMTYPVTVSRITVKDTVEERILAIQEEKRKLHASVFDENQSVPWLTTEELRYLFMGDIP